MAARRLILKFIISIIASLFLIEVYFHASESISQKPQQYKIEAHQFKNLLRLWHQPKVSLIQPPFNILSNYGWNDKSRLEYVYKYSHLPPGFQSVENDFLRNAEVKYSVKINSLGFRGDEISIDKPKDKIRVLGLGSYMTFGHGVNDNETYLEQAEAALNKNRKNAKYEFVNGGMHTGNLILGLSRLHKEFDIIKPDIVIFEYGFNDPFIGEKDRLYLDFLKIAGLKTEAQDIENDYYNNISLIRKYIYLPLMKNFFAGSYLVQSVLKRVSQNVSEEDKKPMYEFLKALSTTTKDLVEKKVRVIWLLHPMLRWDKVIDFDKKAEEVGAAFISSNKAFSANLPTEEQMTSFQNDSSNFLNELGIDRVDSPENRMFYKRYGPYMQSTLQINKLGHQIVGAEVAKHIAKMENINLK